MRDFQGYNFVAHCNYNMLGKSKESCDKLDLCQRLTFAFTSVPSFPSHFFKMSTITLEAFLFLHSFGGDTVCMTLFIVPIFTSVAILALSSHPPLGSSVCQPSKHSLSLIFPIKKAGGIPSRLMSPISQPVPLSRSMSQCTRSILAFQVTGNNEEEGEREFAIKNDVWLSWQTEWRRMSWSPESLTLGQTKWWELYYTIKTRETSAWSHQWLFKIQD